MLARCTGTPGRCGAATPLFPDIVRPPNVALFSYIRGPFVYCTVLLERFIFRAAPFLNGIKTDAVGGNSCSKNF